MSPAALACTTLLLDGLPSAAALRAASASLSLRFWLFLPA